MEELTKTDKGSNCEKAHRVLTVVHKIHYGPKVQNERKNTGYKALQRNQKPVKSVNLVHVSGA